MGRKRRKAGGEMKNKSYGYRSYQKNRKACGADGLMEAVARTRREIDRHYQKPYEPENLLKRWCRLEYHSHSRVNFYTALGVSFLAGFLTAFYCFLMSLPQVTGNLVLLAVLTALFLGLLALALYYIVGRAEKTCDDPYRNFILPYEQAVLLRKMESDCGFSMEPEEPVPAMYDPNLYEYGDLEP